LASVPGIGPAGLRTLLADASPGQAWSELVSGGLRRSGRWSRCAEEARVVDVGSVWESHRRAGICVLVRGSAGYPKVLVDDPEAPAVLFALGDPAVLDGRPRVAIVGARSATRYGLGVAAQLGAELAGAGIVVVSGLALGIDGAAHEGALAAWRTSGAQDGSAEGARPLAAPPVAVVAGSPSSPYPRQHAGLWRRVAEAGAVISEAPVGAADIGWRFPMRNRIIAAVSDVVVVVECHARGGSLHTVQQATRRGITVGAVPGSVRSPASAGTNNLLAEGCFVVRDATDVLAAVALATASASAPLPYSGCRPAPGDEEGRRGPGFVDEARHEATPVLGALGWERCALDELVVRSGLSLAEVSAALERLRAEGRVHGEAGWWERR
jgi:DNA processing protein